MLSLPCSTWASRLLLLAALSTTGAACTSSPPLDPGSFPSEAYVVLESEEGELQLELRTAPEQPPSRGSIAVELRVRRNEQPLTGLQIQVRPWMPSMGHGTSPDPSVQELGEGSYVVHDVNTYMPGEWELELLLTEDQGEGEAHHAAARLRVL